jgi:hypothetical protein
VTEWVPAEPHWAAPATAEIADLMWLAYGSWVASGSQWAAGIMSTAAWVRGGRAAPVTSRPDAPVTRALAEAEFWTSLAVLDERSGSPAFPADAVCARLGVTYAAPQPVDVLWARGTVGTLRWLLGKPGSDGRADPPIPVPVRRPDGSIPTERELYERALSDARSVLVPEQRRRLRQKAQHDVARAHRLDAEIRTIQRELATRMTPATPATARHR